jgi:ferric-dicitrate binding protein FerR (iron transport regulator)
MNNDSNGDGPGRDADFVGELIRRAGRRENPTAAETERVFAAASAALERKIRKRRRRFVTLGLAAAVVVGMAVTGIVANLPTAPTAPLARLDRVIGPAQVADDDAAGWQPVTDPGTTLDAGVRLRTGPATRLGVLMDNGVSLRLAEATEVRFAAPRRVELVAGKIYADAGPGSPDAPGREPRIVVATGADETRDVGTQFEVMYAGGVYRLRVREGRVNLTRESLELTGRAGEQVTIDASRQVRRERIARDDPEWRWAESVAPDPIVDMRSVGALLEWVSRETGRNVEYARPELELKARATMLYGSVHFLEPLEALDTMLATTDFAYTLLEDGTILIDTR